MNCVPPISALSAEPERQAGPPHSRPLSVSLSLQWEPSVGRAGFPPAGCRKKACMPELYWRNKPCICDTETYIVIYSGPEVQHTARTCWLTAKSQSPLSEDTSHPTVKWQVLKICLCLWYLFFRRLEVQLSLVAVVSVAAAIAGEWGDKRDRTHHAESQPTLWKLTIWRHATWWNNNLFFIFHCERGGFTGCSLHGVSTSRQISRFLVL